MKEVNIESYFEKLDGKYVDSKYIILILEDILGSKIANIKEEINSKQVIVTKEEITEYLEKVFEKENPELKRRIENSKTIINKNIIEWTKEDLEADAQRFSDFLSAGRYRYEPDTLEYFKKYTAILKNKILLLLNIIEKIGNKDYISIKDIISELDIQLDEYENITKEDIIRLLTPLIYNINKLNDKISKANNLETYLTFKLSKHFLLRNDLTLEEIYPTESLQIKDLYYDHLKGNVPLSKKQSAELEREQRKSMKKIVKVLLDL